MRLLAQVEDCSATMNKQSATIALLSFVKCAAWHAVNILSSVSICICARILCMQMCTCARACVGACTYTRLGTGSLVTHFKLFSFYSFTPHEELQGSRAFSQCLSLFWNLFLFSSQYLPHNSCTKICMKLKQWRNNVTNNSKCSYFYFNNVSKLAWAWQWCSADCMRVLKKHS